MAMNSGNSLAILRNNGDLIWFDAITQFSERYTGSVSSHPLEDGSVVTDHTTINNLVLSVQGVISDADFNLDRPIINDDDAVLYNINNKQFVNNSPVNTPVEITYKQGIAQYLPESINQFLTPSIPVVTVTEFGRNKFTAKIKAEMIEMSGGKEGVAYESFTLIDFKDGRIDRAYVNCIITSLDFTETVETGDAIYPNMTIEVVRYATTKSVKLQINKGRKNGASGSKTKEDGEGKDEPTGYANTSNNTKLKQYQSIITQ